MAELRRSFVVMGARNWRRVRRALFTVDGAVRSAVEGGPHVLQREVVSATTDDDFDIDAILKLKSNLDTICAAISSP